MHLGPLVENGHMSSAYTLHSSRDTAAFPDPIQCCV